MKSRSKEQVLNSRLVVAYRIFTGLFCLCFLCQCGVKGKPLPPLDPPPLGGSKIDKKIDKIEKSKKKK